VCAVVYCEGAFSLIEGQGGGVAATGQAHVGQGVAQALLLGHAHLEKGGEGKKMCWSEIAALRFEGLWALIQRRRNILIYIYYIEAHGSSKMYNKYIKIVYTPGVYIYTT
jgi:hypothetical protein